MKLLVSACLLGCPCRYDGKSAAHPAVLALREKHTLIPFCPEIYGGLPTPRIPSERVGERVFNREGEDVTAAYRKGAEEALRVMRELSCDAALLKERSPACGLGERYDGTFTHTLTDGDGVCAELLRENGYRVYTESEAAEL